MKTFHSIVRTVLQQGKIVTPESDAWTKHMLSEEVAWSLNAHIAWTSFDTYRNDYPECDMTDDWF